VASFGREAAPRAAGGLSPALFKVYYLSDTPPCRPACFRPQVPLRFSMAMASKRPPRYNPPTYSSLGWIYAWAVCGVSVIGLASLRQL
jgi:hypothetical protein